MQIRQRATMLDCGRSPAGRSRHPRHRPGKGPSPVPAPLRGPHPRGGRVACQRSAAGGGYATTNNTHFGCASASDGRGSLRRCAAPSTFAQPTSCGEKSGELRTFPEIWNLADCARVDL
jgi:hypothetical protein